MGLGAHQLGFPGVRLKPVSGLWWEHGPTWTCRARDRGGGAVGFGVEISRLEKLRPCLEGVRVLVADHVADLLLEALRAVGAEVVYKPGIGRGELLSMINGFDALVVRSRTRVDREILERGAGRLRVVARAGVGLDNIDLEAARRLGVRVVNAPGAATQSVAELTIGLLIAAARRVAESLELARSMVWRKVMGVELYGKTLAVIGFGRIGRRVAEIARAIGMDIVAYDVVDMSGYAAKIGARFTRSLHEALAAADAVTLHVPLTPETRHLISWNEFKTMRQGVILVNTSRGPVVDTEALLWALDNGIVAAAALDVLEHEPPQTEAERRLVQHPRVIVTTHIGASTREAQQRVAVETARKLIDALAGARGCGGEG